MSKRAELRHQWLAYNAKTSNPIPFREWSAESPVRVIEKAEVRAVTAEGRIEFIDRTGGEAEVGS